jgi:hypothetical protein
LPKIATNSLLFLAWKSLQVKSLSFVSGAFTVKVYLRESCIPGKSIKNSSNHIAQFFDVENLSPSRFKNSFAGTFSGKIYSP